MQVNGQIRLGALLSYIYLILNVVIQLIYTPMILRFLGQAEYGLYTLVSSVVGYLSLLNFGFTGSYLRFYSNAVEIGAEEIRKVNGMFLSIFTFLAFVAMASGVVLSYYPEEVFGDKLTVYQVKEAQIMMRILVFNIAATFISSIFDSMIISKEKFVFQKLLLILKSIFNPIISLPLLFAGYGTVAIVATVTGLTIISCIIQIYYCIKKLKIKFSFKDIKLKDIYMLFEFSMYIFLNMIVDQLNWSVGNLILGRYCGLKEVAVYGIASQIRSVFGMFSSPVSSVFAPIVNKIVAKNEHTMNNDLTKLLNSVGRIQYLILLYIFMSFLFFGKWFIILWAGSDFIEAYYITLILILPLVYILPFSLAIEIRRAKNMHRFPVIIMICSSLFNVILSVCFAPEYGAKGTAFATLISLTMSYLWLLHYYNRKLLINTSVLLRTMSKISCREIIPCMVGVCGLFVSTALKSVVWLCIFSVLYILVLYKFILKGEEKKIIKNFIRT